MLVSFVFIYLQYIPCVFDLKEERTYQRL